MAKPEGSKDRGSPSAARPYGLLVAMMEPPPTFEEEFQQWYDSEHFPEREACEGFLTAARFVCLDGFPRYLALYDLADTNVLSGPAYAAIAVQKYSIWTGRVIPRMWGHYRAEGAQIHPGNGLLGGAGNFSRLVVWRFQGVGDSEAAQVVEGLRGIYESQPETAQVRVFAADFAAGKEILGLVELHAPWAPPSSALSRLGPALKRLDMLNTYTRYRRSWPRK